MQVSLYIDEKVLKKVDGVARSERRSRSAVIQSLLEASLFGEPLGGSAADLAGSWKDDRSAEEIIADVYRGRARNRRSERRPRKPR
ncbi:MAG TPA: ribbon-helix-helix protein, CopG family [Polyangia bacterium]|nr:ribbon-helix-helix protein, CopG family [Polyangia bacterium]